MNKEPFTEEEDEIIFMVSLRRRPTGFGLPRSTLTRRVSSTQAHREHGNKWAIIARSLPGRRVTSRKRWAHLILPLLPRGCPKRSPRSHRTDNSIKNHWNSTLKRKCQQMGLDMAAHRCESD